MALGSAQPVTEMSNRNFPGGKRQRACEAGNISAICEPLAGLSLPLFYTSQRRSDGLRM
jgi:hypothetical protein